MKAPVPQAVVGESAATFAIRHVASAIRQCADEAAFTNRVREILRVVPLLQRSTVDLGDPAGVEQAFEAGVYTLPLRGASGVRGLLRHPMDAGPLGADEIGFLHAAADLLGAIVDAAARVRDARRIGALLQFLADQMPVGVACLGPKPTVLACNRAAAGFLGGDPAAVWPALESCGAVTGVVRCLRQGGRMGLVDIRAGAGADLAVSGGVVLIVDCTEAARAFHDALARETYRSLCDHEPLTLVVATGANPEALFMSAEALRALLPARAACGPVDADHFGFVLPALDRPAATMLLRGLDQVRAVRELLVGVASLSDGIRSPEALLEAARGRSVSWTSGTRPELFIFDRALVVTDTLAFVLRSACRTTCANRPELARELLTERPFDGLMLELPAAADPSGADFLRHAIALQPAARPFFVTSQPRPWPLRDLGLPEGTVFRKPFAVQEVRAAVRAAFADGGKQG